MLLQFHIFLQAHENISRCSKISPFWIFNSFLNVLLFPIHWIQGQRPGTLLVSPYICHWPPVFSRSTHCSWSNPISFWIAYSWDTSSFWSNPISFTLWLKRGEKHFYSLIITLFTVFLQFYNFFLQANKNISQCLIKNITILNFDFFKKCYYGGGRLGFSRKDFPYRPWRYKITTTPFSSIVFVIVLWIPSNDHWWFEIVLLHS